MILDFFKYQGTGNDFIIIDNRDFKYKTLTSDKINQLSDRRFGIGADGLILLENEPEVDFKMRYFNSDGGESSMCGNGGRCIVAFAKKLGIINNYTKFMAIDGIHEAIIDEEFNVELKMQDVDQIEKGKDFYYMNTGSPHYVKFIDNIDELDTYLEGRKIRYNERFKKEGTNVNFVKIEDDRIIVKTYERGVEDETLSCGTGITASAISTAIKIRSGKTKYNVSTKGGNLQVKLNKIDDNTFNNIWLIGPATFVYKGTIDI